MVFGHAGTKESSPWVLPGLSSPGRILSSALSGIFSDALHEEEEEEIHYVHTASKGL